MKLNPHILCTLPTTIPFLVFFSIAFLPVRAANNDGFTLDLIHRDSPESPFYNTLLTPSQRAKNAFQRSMKRAKQFASANVVPSTDLGEFLMEISYGTPPFQEFAIIDTGSPVTWTMCLPCNTCNRSSSSLFNPKHSSTFKLVPCPSSKCDEYGSFSSCTTTCEYEFQYADTSLSSGDVATDTLTLAGAEREKLSFPNFTFGCAHSSSGDFTREGAGLGLIGLGPENSSLISQLSSSFDAKFSYCLGPFDDFSKPGKIRFGDNPTLSPGDHKVSTPLYFDSGYTLKLEAISVGNKRIAYDDDDEGGDESSPGNFLIDSGATYTYLPIDLYDSFVSAVGDYVGSKNIVSDPNEVSALCYDSSNISIVIPKITMHFAGADLELNPENVFQRTSDSLFCLGFLQMYIGYSVLGNWAQSNFWVEYDLRNKVLSFQRANCANH